MQPRTVKKEWPHCCGHSLNVIVGSVAAAGAVDPRIARSVSGARPAFTDSPASCGKFDIVKGAQNFVQKHRYILSARNVLDHSFISLLG